MNTRNLHGIAALSFALGLIGCAAEGGANGPSEANPIDAEESRLLYEFNRFREDAGIAQIIDVCASLNSAASAHSDDMRDKGYLADEAPDGSVPRTRACDAGYQPACDESATIAEVVGFGLEEGKGTFAQWEADEKTKAVLMTPAFIVGGVGRSLGGSKPIWTLLLASKSDPSCQSP